MRKSSSRKFFSQVPDIRRPRSSFDRSFGVKTTFDAGYLIPIFVDQAIPGDTMVVDMEALARLATPIKPTMDNLYMETFFFFVPRRLTWSNFQKYMGERANPDDSIDYLIPVITSPDGVGAEVHSLFDYLSVPLGTEADNLSIRADITRSYNLIWNSHFRDANLQDSAVVDLDDGPDTYTDYVLLRRGKRADYFTTATLTPQKGETVLIPGTDYLPVHGIGKTDQTFESGAATVYMSDGTTDSYTLNNNATINPGAASGTFKVEESTLYPGYPGIHVDMTENTEATMIALRTAEAMQVFYEQLNRGGSRYIEQNRYLFGVESDDGRLQRPEFLGGGSTRINITPIPQQDATGAGTPQGNLAGVGTANLRGHGFTRSFKEHGIVMGLVSVRADINYQNCLERWYTVRSRDEEYFPPFANLSDQAILNKEIYPQDNGARELVFGYTERYAEYKQKFSVITGLFRSNVTGSLDLWHYATDFDALPELGDTFIQEDPPIDRTIATPTQPHFLFNAEFRFTHVRPIPTHAIPGLGATRF